MKKVLLLLSATTFSMLFSQEQKMNIVKTNLTAYAFRNVNLSYERSITKRISVNVGFGTMGEGSVPFLKQFIGDEDKEFTDIKVGMTTFTIEPRFYLGEGYGKGFYLAPYYRHSKFKANNFVYTYEYEHEDGTVIDIPLDVSGTATANSFGLMFGVQFLLGKKQNWVLDWWILGGHYGNGKGDFNGKSQRTLTADEQAAIKLDLEELGIPIIEYKVTTSGNGANIKLNGPWAGLRSGLSFGYRF